VPAVAYLKASGGGGSRQSRIPSIFAECHAGRLSESPRISGCCLCSAAASGQLHDAGVFNIRPARYFSRAWSDRFVVNSIQGVVSDLGAIVAPLTASVYSWIAKNQRKGWRAFVAIPQSFILAMRLRGLTSTGMGQRNSRVRP
jgi:hypothetical protein